MMHYYTTLETASLLGLKPKSIPRYIQREVIHAEKRGRDYFISQDEIERFQRERHGPGRPKK